MRYFKCRGESVNGSSRIQIISTYALIIQCTLVLVNVSLSNGLSTAKASSTPSVHLVDTSTVAPIALESSITSESSIDDITTDSPESYESVENAKKISDQAQYIIKSLTGETGPNSRQYKVSPAPNEPVASSASVKDRHSKNLLSISLNDPAIVKKYASSGVIYRGKPLKINYSSPTALDWESFEQECLASYPGQNVVVTFIQPSPCQLNCTILTSTHPTAPNNGIYPTHTESKTINRNSRSQCHETDPSRVCIDGRCRNPQKGTLRLVIFNATLENDDIDETYNSFIRVYLKGQLTLVTRIQRNTNRPRWNQVVGMKDVMKDEPIEIKLISKHSTGETQLFSHQLTVSQIKSHLSLSSTGPTCQAFPDSPQSKLCFQVDWTPQFK